MQCHHGALAESGQMPDGVGGGFADRLKIFQGGNASRIILIREFIEITGFHCPGCCDGISRKPCPSTPGKAIGGIGQIPCESSGRIQFPGKSGKVVAVCAESMQEEHPFRRRRIAHDQTG